jgi:L-aminopeptidase/D-esterase-like protein
MTLTRVPGVEVGHWTDLEGATGVTVVVFPEPNVAAVEIRGAAPGTRETALLAPGMRVETVQAIVLSGGSAFGLAAADGVVRALEADGRGHPTAAGVVPIVPAAILFDLFVGSRLARPDAAAGDAAYRARSSGPVPMGSVGAGTGAIVAGWRGFEHVRKGGVGSHAEEVGDAVVGALAVVNAVGDVFTLEGESLTGGAPIPPGSPAAPRPLENTTLVVVATDALLDRAALSRVCVQAHDALAVCLRPGHTRYDGDAVFAVSCGEVSADLDAIGSAAFVTVGRAIEAALRHATGLGGVPAMGDER